MKTNKPLYEAIEQHIMRSDEDGDSEVADRLRDVLDFVWHKRLEKSERDELNARGNVALKPAP